MNKKRFIALSRVSSREQEREGFSLDVQDDALRRFADREDGEIVHHIRVAETASKRDERKAFKELLVYAKKNASRIDGVLFHKVDRAARNLHDYLEIERLEEEYELNVYFVTQPTERNPAGRMQRRILANMAAFYTEQQALDVKEGQKRRVENGLFVGHAPFGFQNVRRNGRSLVEEDPVNAPKVQAIFRMYANEGHTLDSLRKALFDAGVFYSEVHSHFPRSKLHVILTDRSYIGEVLYRGQWFEGAQKPLIDRDLWDRTQARLGNKVYHQQQNLYAGRLIRCAHCGCFITGEAVTKKATGKTYRYYRCSQYRQAGHPRVRLPEGKLDKQVLSLLQQLEVTDGELRDWIMQVLRAKTLKRQDAEAERRKQLRDQLSRLERQERQLLNVALAGEFDPATVAGKNQQLRDDKSRIAARLAALERGSDESTDIAIKTFELSQRLRKKWVKADYRAKRQILNIIGLNFELHDVTLCVEWRKPFDILANGVFAKDGRGDRI